MAEGVREQTMTLDQARAAYFGGWTKLVPANQGHRVRLLRRNCEINPASFFVVFGLSEPTYSLQLSKNLCSSRVEESKESGTSTYSGCTFHMPRTSSPCIS